MKFTGERLIPDENREDVMYIEHLNRYVVASSMVKDKVVLDIASGSGYGSDILQKAGARKVFGVDISKEAVKYSKERYAGVDFTVGSVEKIPLEDDSVDVVVSFETIEHVDGKAQEKFIKEVKRVLRGDGVFMVSTPNSSVYPKGNPYHIKEFTLDEFKSFLKKDFSNVTMLFQENAESNYIFSEGMLIDDTLTDDFSSFKINKIDPEESQYVIGVCSNKKTDIDVKGQTMLFDSIPRIKYQTYNTEIRELKTKIKNQSQQIKNQRQQLEGLSAHINRLYQHPAYMIKHWIKQVAKKVLPKAVVERLARAIVKKKTSNKKKNRIFFRKIKFQSYKKPEVSVVIPVFNKWEYTYECLLSIQKTCSDLEYEVIVVDNASTDKTEERIKKIENIKYIRNEKNAGFGGACNQGAKEARGKYIVFLNNDTVVWSGWLENLLLTFERHENIGLVGSKLVYPDGRLQEAGGIVWQNKSACNYGNLADPGEYEFNYFKDVDYCSGASVMVPTDIFKKLKGFDDMFTPAYYEDTDFAFKIRQMGLRTVYQPKSVLTHFEGVTAGRDTSKGLKKYQEVNQEKFFKRWKDVLEEENYRSSEEIFLARDRSKGKKVMLFVDHRIPAHDQDAGSFLTIQYLKIFQELGYKIIFWPHDKNKLEPYATEIQQMGIEVVYGNVSFEDFIFDNGRYINTTVLSRPNVANDFINLVREHTESKIIYIAHDLHYLREARGAEVNGSKKEREMAIKTKEIELGIMKKSDVSLFVSDKEIGVVKSESKDIKADIMTWIQEVGYDEEKDLPFNERDGLLFLGGFGHPPNTDGVKWFHDKVLPLIKNDIKDIKVTIAGSNPTDEILKLNSPAFEIMGFVEEDQIDNLFNKSKIFIAPLRYGAGFKGKVAKAMSFGLPVVTTDIGSEGIGLTDGKNVMIANNERAFAKKIIKLYRDEKVWKKLSTNSVNHIKDNYSPSKAKKRIEETIASL